MARFEKHPCSRLWWVNAMILLALPVLLAVNAPVRAQILPGGMTSGGFVGDGTSSTYEITIRVVEDPGQVPYFWANQFWIDTATDHGGYFGLQAIGSPGDGTYRRMSIFSIWNAVEAIPAAGAIAVPFGGEGIGWSLRRPDKWRAGVPYTFRLTRHDDVWWNLTVSAPGEPTLEFGSIRVTVGAPLRSGFNTFTEYYVNAPSCDVLPFAQVVFENGKYGSNVTRATSTNAYGNCKENAEIYPAGVNAVVHRSGLLRSRSRHSNFDGDARSDILWRNFSTGSNAIWLSASHSDQLATMSVSDLAWHIVGTSDYDGNGFSDILWRNSVTGANVVWPEGDVSTIRYLASVPNLDWRIVGSGDFDADGKSDILWRKDSTGSIAVWPSGDHLAVKALTPVADQAWKISGISDFNGDGRSDVLWRNSSTGANTIWLSGSSGDQQLLLTVTNLDWRMVGVGDFNGDGKGDIFWRNSTTGANTIWLSGSYSDQQVTLGVSDLDWHVAGTGDYDGDGRSDVLWRNQMTGQNVIWPSGKWNTLRYLLSVADLAWQTIKL